MPLRTAAVTGVGLLASAAAGALAVGPYGSSVALLVTVVVAVAAFAAVRSAMDAPALGMAVLLLVAGYIVFNRNFAELHVSLGPLPIYIGELVLAMALPWALSRRIAWSPTPGHKVFFILLGVWMAFCVVRLLLGGLDYGVNGLRDSAVWYYGLFAIIGYVLWPLVRPAAWVVFFGVVFVAQFLFASTYVVPTPLNLPFGAGREDIMAANLIAGGSFFLLVLRRARLGAARVAFATAALAFTVPLEVRSATVAALMLLGVFALQRRWSTLLALVGIPMLALVLVALTGIQLKTRAGDSSAGALFSRQLSAIPFLADQNPVSTTTDSASAADATVQWRLNWWSGLWSDTTASPETALFGLGFGTDITGPLGWDQSNLDRPLRSPHNIMMTMFARTGAVGLALWLAVQGSWLYVASRGIAAGVRSGRAGAGDDLLWLFSYGLAILVIANFGVVLEGPHGGITYFFLVGLSLARAAEYAREVPARVEQKAPGRRLVRARRPVFSALEPSAEPLPR